MYDVYKQLKPFGQVKTNVPLAKFSTFKIGGPADFVITVIDVKQMASVLSFLSGRNIPYFILGGGSNVLFPDAGWHGAVILNHCKKITVNGTSITAEAGAALSQIVLQSIGEGLTGFEWAAGIPGTVGGAVRGNAGARYAFCGGEIKDSLVSAEVWSQNETLAFTNEDCAFAYRDSTFKHDGGVVLSATFAFETGSKLQSVATMQKVIVERQGKHATEPSAGSFFKNVMLADWKRDPSELPPRFMEYKKIAAGWLVDQVEMKGYRVGDAMVSETHGNFIINAGGATQADVLKVVEKVTEEVYNRFGITLEPEVQIVR